MIEICTNQEYVTQYIDLPEHLEDHADDVYTVFYQKAADLLNASNVEWQPAQGARGGFHEWNGWQAPCGGGLWKAWKADEATTTAADSAIDQAIEAAEKYAEEIA